MHCARTSSDRRFVESILVLYLKHCLQILFYTSLDLEFAVRNWGLSVSVIVFTLRGQLLSTLIARIAFILPDLTYTIAILVLPFLSSVLMHVRYPPRNGSGAVVGHEIRPRAHGTSRGSSNPSNPYDTEYNLAPSITGTMFWTPGDNALLTFSDARN
ncbi:hypothetical protein BDZ89DRAFT_1147481 [Hymenopellis radicata]|nr:hypothetical protein BDZ89DRAFT_1147481 [Hymenopellis radicata]